MRILGLVMGIPLAACALNTDPSQESPAETKALPEPVSAASAAYTSSSIGALLNVTGLQESNADCQLRCQTNCQQRQLQCEQSAETSYEACLASGRPESCVWLFGQIWCGSGCTKTSCDECSSAALAACVAACGS
jgi:hypothetical protein